MTRPYLTLAQLADYLAYSGTPRGKVNAARRWVERTGIQKFWRGKVWLFHPDHVDALLRGETVTK